MSGFSEIVRSIGGEPSSRVLTRDIIPAGASVASHLYLPEDGPVFHLTRLRLIGDTPAVLETSYLSLARFPGIDRFDFEDVSLSRVLADEYGAEAVHVTLRVTVARATGREASLMGIEPGDLIFLECGTRMGSDTNPIEYYRTRYSPSHFRISCKTVM